MTMMGCSRGDYQLGRELGRNEKEACKKNLLVEEATNEGHLLALNQLWNSRRETK